MDLYGKEHDKNSKNFRWSCHFDDDNYVNVDELIKTLRQFDPNEDWYLGRPSTNGPIKIDDSGAKVRHKNIDFLRKITPGTCILVKNPKYPPWQ
jgi:hypothetical protein